VRALLRLRAIGSRARLHWRLFRHPEVPRATKAILIAVAAYAIVPFDLIPDWAPGIGILDDLSLILAGLWLFERLCPPEILALERSPGGRRRASPGR
jgi:uncharacterized membrane protein YkvA (DUF1232 family)